MKGLGIQCIGNNKFVIVYQTHRGDSFGFRTDRFSCKKGKIISCTLPACDNDILFVRGHDTWSDYKIVDCIDINKIISMVKQYNEYMRDK